MKKLFLVLCLSLFGCVGEVEVEETIDVEEIPFLQKEEGDAVFESDDAADPFVPVEPVEEVAPIPVDRAGRPMFDAEGNSLSIDERIKAAEELEPK